MKKTLGRTATAIAVVALLVVGGVASDAHANPFIVGDIFASTGSGNVQHRNSAGVLLETLNNGSGGFTTGSAFDSAGNFYLTNFGSNTVTRFAGPGDPHTSSLFGGGYSTPEAIVFAADGHVLVGSVGVGGIREFDAAGNFVKTIAAGVRVDWFDLAADQNTILFTQEAGQVRTASRSTGAVGANFSNAGGVFALRILPGGGVLVANSTNVLRLNAAGNIIQTYDVAGVNDFFALNLHPDGTSFFTGAISNGTLYRFDIASGAQSDIFSTGCGSNCLFGVSIFGEITVGNPPDLNPVPEPATLLLLGTGLAGAAGAAWKRRKGVTAKQ